MRTGLFLLSGFLLLAAALLASLATAAIAANAAPGATVKEMHEIRLISLPPGPCLSLTRREGGKGRAVTIVISRPQVEALATLILAKATNEKERLQLLAIARARRLLASLMDGVDEWGCARIDEPRSFGPMRASVDARYLIKRFLEEGKARVVMEDQQAPLEFIYVWYSPREHPVGWALFYAEPSAQPFLGLELWVQ